MQWQLSDPQQIYVLTDAPFGDKLFTAGRTIWRRAVFSDILYSRSVKGVMLSLLGCVHQGRVASICNALPEICVISKCNACTYIYMILIAALQIILTFYVCHQLPSIILCTLFWSLLVINKSLYEIGAVQQLRFIYIRTPAPHLTSR